MREYEEERRNVPTWAIVTACVVGGFLFLFCLGSFAPDDSPQTVNKKEESKEEPQDGPSKVDAWVAAQSFVEDKLKSPSTAKWGWQVADDVVTKTGDNTFRVNAWVDSQNTFGATVRTNFVCELEYRGDDNWRMTRLEME